VPFLVTRHPSTFFGTRTAFALPARWEIGPPEGLREIAFAGVDDPETGEYARTMLSKLVAVCAFMISALVVACSGTASSTGDGGASSSSSSGSSGSPGATPRVTFDSSISPGAHSAKECGKTGTFFTVGSFGNPALGRVNPNDPESPLKDPVRPVDDGGDDQLGKVSVSCSVKANGERFDVAAHAELTGANGGAVTVTGSFARIGDQPSITVALTKKGETFSATNCIARFDTTVGQAVAAGRVWAEVDCANAEQPSAQQICATRAQLRFENCTQ